MKGKPSDLLKKDNNMETLTKDFSTGAIVWYNFKSPCKIMQSRSRH